MSKAIDNYVIDESAIMPNDLIKTYDEQGLDGFFVDFETRNVPETKNGKNVTYVTIYMKSGGQKDGKPVLKRLHIAAKNIPITGSIPVPSEREYGVTLPSTVKKAVYDETVNEIDPETGAEKKVTRQQYFGQAILRVDRLFTDIYNKYKDTAIADIADAPKFNKLVQETVSKKNKDTSARGKKIEDPVFRLKLRFATVGKSKTPSVLKTTLWDANTRHFKAGSKKPSYREATFGRKKEAINYNNIHLYIKPYSKYTGVINCTDISFSSMGISIPMYPKNFLIIEPSNGRKTSPEEVFEGNFLDDVGQEGGEKESDEDKGGEDDSENEDNENGDESEEEPISRKKSSNKNKNKKNKKAPEPEPENDEEDEDEGAGDESVDSDDQPKKPVKKTKPKAKVVTKRKATKPKKQESEDEEEYDE